MKNCKPVSFIGYGNPIRGDDGLGPALIMRLKKGSIEGIETRSGRQLAPEDALDISGSNMIVFVDASIDCGDSFSFYEIKPEFESAFSSDLTSPQSILAHCVHLFNGDCRGYMLAIRGYEWELIDAISPAAASNLNDAYYFIENWLLSIPPVVKHS